MQRVLSLETSRSSNLTSSEFVSKRLCCSFILTVAFFAVIGGFFLGRFATEKTLQKLKMEINEISKKLTVLDKTLTSQIRDNNCSVFSSWTQCPHFLSPVPLTRETSTQSVQELVDALNYCFNHR